MGPTNSSIHSKVSSNCEASLPKKGYNKTPECPIRRVIKCGEGRRTTVGGLSGFLSHVRQYFVTGNIDSVEVAIHPHDDSSAFSRGGDSGSVIVDTLGKICCSAQCWNRQERLAGHNPRYARRAFLWPLILAKFGGANLYWDGDDNFLSSHPFVLITDTFNIQALANQHASFVPRLRFHSPVQTNTLTGEPLLWPGLVFPPFPVSCNQWLPSTIYV
ncbi:hypothetical protein BDN72DRAFT_462443 [Pluteus cervinus]|uniref:Uncharacterized protein n=1 Tax=Pluteus cervinus TaxID=181527 RepID=A0ACD3B0L0_9AGAR|nr:hypothetical protein BDN72DRAFT_462443 [Pluteus cervinus]